MTSSTDRTYDASPLSDSGRDAMDEWVREKYRERMAPMLNMLTGDALLAAMNTMMKTLPTLSFVSEEGAKFVGTVDGMARLVYEMIRPNHPDVSYDVLRGEMTSPEHIRRANSKFRELEQLDAAKATNEGKPTDL